MGRGNKGVIPCICIVTGGEPGRRHKEQVSMTLSQGPTQPSPGIRRSSLMGVMQTHTRDLFPQVSPELFAPFQRLGFRRVN